MTTMPEKLLASLAHPVRRAALEAIATAPASPSEIAEQIGAELGVVSYHVRFLADAGLIRIHHTEPVRGAMKHVYKLASVNGLAGDLRELGQGLEVLAGTLEGAAR